MAKQTKDKGNKAESEAKLLKNETKKLGKSSTKNIGKSEVKQLDMSKTRAKKIKHSYKVKDAENALLLKLKDGEVVIEMNPRVSRSSALASKATGFPIARISAKLAVGYTLDEVQNEITGESVSCFEPALDYVAVKVPRFELEKFPLEAAALGTQMRSVGEALALGRTALESLNKAFRSSDGLAYTSYWRSIMPVATMLR